VDVAREREDEAVHLAALQRRHELDTTMNEVLHSLATGQYGRCSDCGQHIALARLRAMPLAVRCLACQDRFERVRRAATARTSRYEMPNVQEVVL
jgi:DnaK suppressor protein